MAAPDVMRPETDYRQNDGKGQRRACAASGASAKILLGRLGAEFSRYADDARHHMSHFMEEVEPSKADLAGEAMEHLNTGEFHEGKEPVKQHVESGPHQHHHHDQ